MNKIETAFCKRLKEVYPEEIQRDMDINYHVKGQNGKSCTIFGEKISQEFREKFATDFGKKGQAYSIVSSAIAAYNFFCWVCDDKPIDLGELGVYNEVSFEFPLKTFFNRKSSAKMDVVLVNRSKASCLFIESKFTEHFRNKKFSIPDAYKCPANYFLGGNGAAWSKIAMECENVLKRKKGYCEGIKQEICHLVGICASRTVAYNGRRPLECEYVWRLRNVAFNPKPECVNGSNPYGRYASLYTDFKALVTDIVDGMDIDLIDYAPIWAAICKAFPDPEDPYRKFIWDRYIQFSKI